MAINFTILSPSLHIQFILMCCLNDTAEERDAALSWWNYGIRRMGGILYRWKTWEEEVG